MHSRNIALVLIVAAVAMDAQVTFPSLNASPFLGQEMLGRATNSSVTVNVAFDRDMQVYFEYGTASGIYTVSTSIQIATANVPLNVLLSNLQSNAKYYYRMQYAPTGSSSFVARPEHSFHTQRSRGSAFTFTIQADPHMDANSNSDVYKLTLLNELADAPDFMLDLGDVMMSDKLNAQGIPVDNGAQPNASGVLVRTQMQRSYHDLVAHSVPLFLALGNHEGEWGKNLNGTAQNVAVWDTQSRNAYYPNPAPDGVFTGDTQRYNFVGQRRSYYSWEWGDALFIVLDPFWSQPSSPDCCVNGDWSLTLGRAQYDWLKQTLENSTATYKFVFSHNLVGGVNPNGLGPMRGGIEAAKYLEWGGYNLDGTWGFDKQRPGWPMPIHQLLVANHVTAYFHGHDHLYAKQDLDGIVYHEIPQPSASNANLGTRATDYGYTHGTTLGGRGYLRVQVSLTGVKVEYVETWLPTEVTSSRKNGMVADAYTMVPSSTNNCVAGLSPGGQAFDVNGGNATLSVSAATNCAWTVTGLPAWITLQSPVSGTGPGTVFYQVSANVGPARSVILNLNGLNFTVEQAAASIPGLSSVGTLAQVASQGTWKFTLDAVNLSATSSAVRMNFTGNDGSPLALPLTFPQAALSGGPEIAATLDRTLNANSQLIVESSGPDSAPQLAGWGQLLANGGVTGFGIFSNTLRSWNAVVPLESRNAGSYFLAFDNTGTLATGVAVANLTNAVSTVPVIVRDDTGSIIAGGTVALPSLGHKSFLLTDSSDGFPITSGKRGTIEFQTPQGGQISVLGLRANGPALTTLPIIASGDLAGSIAHVTYNGGFTSTFYLTNTGVSPAEFSLKFLDEFGNPLTVPLFLPQTGTAFTASSFTRQLAAGAMLVIETRSNDSAASISGSAQLTASGTISGFEVFRWTTYGQEASVPLETRNPKSFVLLYDNTNGLTTGVALSNVTASAAAVPVKIFDDAGNLLQTVTLNLASNGHSAFLLPIAYPATNNIRGMVELVVPPNGKITAIGLRAKSDGTLTTIPSLTK